jgi:hypothetical protein
MQTCGRRATSLRLKLKQHQLRVKNDRNLPSVLPRLIFALFGVHSKTGKVKVDRLVCVADGGKIVNDKAAANQLSGAAVGGIGMALMEEQHSDKKFGSLGGQ